LKVIPSGAADQFISPDASSSPELFCATISSAEVIPRDFGVLSEGRVFSEGVMNWGWHYGRGGHFSVHESDDMRLLMEVPGKMHRFGGACVLVGGGGDQYQWLFDSLSRLWIVGQLPALRSLPLVIPANLSEGRMAMLDHLGIGRERLLLVEDDEILEADILHVPSVMSMGNWVSPVALQFLRRHFGGGSGNRSRRFYFSRAHFPDRRLANEPEVMNLLEQYGFERVESDKLTPMDFMGLFVQSEAVIGIDGDTLANVVVAPQGAKLGIIPTGGTHRARAHYICGQLAIDATYMIGEIDYTSHADHALCDVVLPLSVLQTFLDGLDI
jgi:capsular polysaccharide biosynthesis protein